MGSIAVEHDTGVFQNNNSKFFSFMYLSIRLEGPSASFSIKSTALSLFTPLLFHKAESLSSDPSKLSPWERNLSL